ncbi:MAG: 3-oxoacyl-[acyl-carrier-protein] reductase [Firmicutes bacterium]|nr:3-oxoacyl-[acyl-carrier-protein] reductase [Bacillota bacterium]
MNLSGKVALVTGGSRGIGKEIALKLASLGADIIINYSRNSKKAEEVVSEIENMGRKAYCFQADVSKLEEVEKLVKKTLDEVSNVDILVNNAGITKDNLLMRMSKDDWNDVINVNLTGAYNLCKSLIRTMIRKKNGCIINISSVVGITGNPGQCNYSASKAGLIGLTKSLAKEVGKKNIRVNAIAPGFIETEMTDKLNENVIKEYKKNIPLKKLGSPEDIANTVAFLASDLASYITGQVIVVDGGMSN